MSIVYAIECDKCNELLMISSPEEAAEQAKENGWDFDEVTHCATCNDCDPED